MHWVGVFMGRGRRGRGRERAELGESLRRNMGDVGGSGKGLGGG